MAVRRSRLDSVLAKLETALADFPAASVDRIVSDAAALRFHLSGSTDLPIVAVLGGTGTGKSTLVNRLVERDVTTASLLRTYTAGPIAILADEKLLPKNWLRFPHFGGGAPARGVAGQLTTIIAQSALANKVTLIDTPDLDGDRPEHHAQGDRAFRWSHGIVFVVTPEKYQMTELMPYYRLARRYAIPAWFVMNKCEEDAVAEDYRKLLGTRDWKDAQVFVVPRDDAGYAPPAGRTLEDLRGAIGGVEASEGGLANRATDLAQRLVDQVIAPGRARRAEAERIIGALRAMERPSASVDVNPVTASLQRRLQQRSVLYLIGPQRLLDRVRQVPTLVARLPRTFWDVFRGETPAIPDPTQSKSNGNEVPDFGSILEDQFRILQTRIDDIVRSSDAKWGDGLDAARMPLSLARVIADEELAALKAWLEKRWEKDPRDTRLIMSFLRHLPGGRQLTKWSEAAPYLLAIIVATHGAFFGHLDLLILGGYSVMTWLTERVSNEVAARTRATNRTIEERFARLAHEQIERVSGWIERQSPSSAALDRLQRLAMELQSDEA